MSEAETEALRPGHTSPWNPAAAARYVPGSGDGWHAVDRDWVNRVAAQARSRCAADTAAAVCGQLVTVAWEHGIYDRTAAPVHGDPCPHCAWAVAIEAGRTGRELSFLRPRRCEAAALARAGSHPLLAFLTGQAILAAQNGPAASYGLDHPATAQILACLTRHRPVLPSRCDQGTPAGDWPGADRTGGAWACRCGEHRRHLPGLHAAGGIVGGGVGGRPGPGMHRARAVQRADDPGGQLPGPGAAARLARASPGAGHGLVASPATSVRCLAMAWPVRSTGVRPSARRSEPGTTRWCPGGAARPV
jgi:hypothetical protein